MERNPGGPDNYKIWEVGRATSAAPTYFKAARLEEEDEKSEYIDGMSSSLFTLLHIETNAVLPSPFQQGIPELMRSQAGLGLITQRKKPIDP